MTTYGTIPTSSSPSGKSNVEYISRAKARLTTGLNKRRPWKQVFDYHQIGIPSSITDSFERLKLNLTYFAMNYTLISLIILFITLLWHPISLIVFIVMISAWLFFYFLRDVPLVVFNRTIDDRLVLISLSLFTLAALFLTSATWNILSSVFISSLFVLLHGLFRNTDDLSFDDEESGAFYTGIPSSSS